MRDAPDVVVVVLLGPLASNDARAAPASAAFRNGRCTASDLAWSSGGGTDDDDVVADDDK